MMDDKYIYSAIGIILGWALRQLSTVEERQVERKQKLSQAIASLMSFHREIILLRANLEKWKTHSVSAESYERIRQYITSRISNRNSHLCSSLDTAIETVALYYPLEAVTLDDTITGLEFHNTIKLSESSKKRDFYLVQLSILEVGVDLAIKRIASSLLKLARKHGVVTWLRIRKELKRIQDNDLLKAASPILDPLFEELRKHEKSKQ